MVAHCEEVHVLLMLFVVGSALPSSRSSDYHDVSVQFPSAQLLPCGMNTVETGALEYGEMQC